MSESSKIDLHATSQEQACAIISSAIHHLLFAKGQIHQPIAVLRKQRDQRDGNNLFQNEDQERRKKSSFTAQRKDRKLNEMIVNVDKLHDQIVHAIEALTASREVLNGDDDDVVLLLRLGQSPLTMARQQFIIQLNGLLSLPRTAFEADKQNPPKPSIARQVFGGKKNSSTDHAQSSLSRIPVLERKLVRFFLSANMDDSGLGKALSAPIAPTRSQIFIQAPRLGFAAKGWIPRPSLKVVKEYETDVGRKTQSTNNQERSEEGNKSYESIGTTAEDVDTLALGLSPLKRRALMSPKSEGLNFTKKLKPLIFRQDSDLDYDRPAQGGLQTDSQVEPASSPLNAIKPNLNPFTDSTVAEEPTLTAQDLIDQKRMTRMQSRPTHKKILNSKLDVAKHSQSKPIRKQRMVCATIVINFTTPRSEKQDDHPTHNAKDDNNHIWFASDIVMQACTF